MDEKSFAPVVSSLIREERLQGLPRDRLQEPGTGSEVAYDMITNELLLDGSARLNLATFVSTWMPPHAGLLMGLTADKNMIDKDEYPQTAEIERRCVNMIGHLWHVPGDGDATGTSTTGSSEAAMLGGLALKWRWRERMQAAGKPPTAPTSSRGSTSRSAGRSSAATGMSNRDSYRWRAIATTSMRSRRSRSATRTRSAW